MASLSDVGNSSAVRMAGGTLNTGDKAMTVTEIKNHLNDILKHESPSNYADSDYACESIGDELPEDWSEEDLYIALDLIMDWFDKGD